MLRLLDNAQHLLLHLAVTFGVCRWHLALCWQARCWSAVRAWREAQPRASGLGRAGAHRPAQSAGVPLWYGPFQVAALVADCCGEHASPGTGAALGCSLGAGLGGRRLRRVDYQRVGLLYQPAPGVAAPLWARAQGVVVVADAVDFARLTTTPVTAAGAELRPGAAVAALLSRATRGRTRLTARTCWAMRLRWPGTASAPAGLPRGLEPWRQRQP